MSAWTRERHDDVRRRLGATDGALHCGWDDGLDGPMQEVVANAHADLMDAATEIERLRPELAGPAPEDRDEKVALFASRLWAAAVEVSEGDTTPVPAFEDMTPRERDALAAITDSVVSAITVLLSSRQPGPEEEA